MNGLSLCSGIGGLDLGLRLVVPNYRTICYVEKEPYCQNILLARMADGVLDRAPIWGDLTAFSGVEWRGLVDIVHGGYPCQPFSVAGKRRGAADKRHLWPDIARIVRECEPEWCFFENVAGHLTLGLDVVARDLEAMDYRVAAGLFTAAEVGAPHRRQRLYILAHRNHEHDDGRRHAGPRRRPEPSDGYATVGCADDSRLEGRRESEREGADEWPAWPPGPEERDRWSEILKRWPELAPALADTYNPRRGRTPVHLPVWREGEGVPDTDRAGGGVAATETQAQPAVRGVADGLPRRVDRLKALGNAVVPAVAALAWATLTHAISQVR